MLMPFHQAGFCEPALRCRHITIITTNKMIIKTIRIGIKIEMNETTVAVMSSSMLTGVFPTPPVVAVTAGRTTADLTV
jgi:hypothetical protein